MKKDFIIEQGKYKYFRANLMPIPESNVNLNFELLLDFIGKQPMYKQLGNNNIGRAYKIIIKKTNEKLGFNRKDLILRTSKREIAALRYFYEPIVKKKTKKFVKIPYKLEYIFISIIDILEEIHNKNDDSFNQDMSSDLKKLMNKYYVSVFCNEHEQAYSKVFKELPPGFNAQRALDGDFHGDNSPLQKKFK